MVQGSAQVKTYRNGFFASQWNHWYLQHSCQAKDITLEGPWVSQKVELGRMALEVRKPASRFTQLCLWVVNYVFGNFSTTVETVRCCFDSAWWKSLAWQLCCKLTAKQKNHSYILAPLFSRLLKQKKILEDYFFLRKPCIYHANYT